MDHACASSSDHPGPRQHKSEHPAAVPATARAKSIHHVSAADQLPAPRAPSRERRAEKQLPRKRTEPAGPLQLRFSFCPVVCETAARSKRRRGRRVDQLTGKSAPASRRRRVDELTAKSARANLERRPVQVRFDFRARASRLSAVARSAIEGDYDAIIGRGWERTERARAIEESPPWCVRCRLPMRPNDGFPLCACERDERVHREAIRRARRLQILDNFLRPRDREVHAAVFFALALAIESEAARAGEVAAHLPAALAAKVGALVGAIAAGAGGLERLSTVSTRANSRARKSGRVRCS